MESILSTSNLPATIALITVVIAIAALFLIVMSFNPREDSPAPSSDEYAQRRNDLERRQHEARDYLVQNDWHIDRPSRYS